jgi:hypothetical protein
VGGVAYHASGTLMGVTAMRHCTSTLRTPRRLYGDGAAALVYAQQSHDVEAHRVPQAVMAEVAEARREVGCERLERLLTEPQHLSVCERERDGAAQALAA